MPHVYYNAIHEAGYVVIGLCLLLGVEAVFVKPGGICTIPHQTNAKEHLSVFSGNVVLDVAGTRKDVREGETARYPVDVQHSITNV
jgi:mannose-6-phosphate isomerase-like protein (cupin superfamily)